MTMLPIGFPVALILAPILVGVDSIAMSLSIVQCSLVLITSMVADLSGASLLVLLVVALKLCAV